jgi:hypothetical protein
VTFASPRGVAAGGRPACGPTKGRNHAGQQGLQAPRSRAHAQDGRSYTAALAYSLQATSPPAPPKLAVPGFAKLGMSSRPSGRPAALGGVLALHKEYTPGATASAEYVRGCKVPDWWCGRAVGEQIKDCTRSGSAGRRLRGQPQQNGGAPVDPLRAFAPMSPQAWLLMSNSGCAGTPDKSVRITWNDDTSVEVWLTPKEPAKTSSVAHQARHQEDAPPKECGATA